MEQLARWWTKKYQLPWNHELFQERNLLDLMVEYWLDVYDDKPLEAHRNEDGFIQMKDTGDSLIDKWEEKIAAGEEPDLTEAFSPESWEALDKIRANAKNTPGTNTGMTGMTMKDIMDRVDKDARLQGLREPSRIRTFGDD